MHHSVATTSTKAPAALKADIRRVLDRMQVQYRETKTGFDCIHLPSIDISSLQDPQATPTPSSRKHRKQGSGGSGDSGGTTRRIVRKASKLSFGMSRKDKDRGGEASVNGTTHKEKEKELPGPPSASGAGPTFGSTQSSGSSSFFNVSTNAPTTVHPDDASATLHPDDPQHPSHSPPVRGKNLPPIPRDFGGATPQQQHLAPPTGEVDREVFESVGKNTLSVRFEINIVKVRLPRFLVFLFLDLTCFFFFSLFSLFFLGPVVAITWYTIPSGGRRWMAVPDACTTSPDGAETLTCNNRMNLPVYSYSLSHLSLLPESARCYHSLPSVPHVHVTKMTDTTLLYPCSTRTRSHFPLSYARSSLPLSLLFCWSHHVPSRPLVIDLDGSPILSISCRRSCVIVSILLAPFFLERACMIFFLLMIRSFLEAPAAVCSHHTTLPQTFRIASHSRLRTASGPTLIVPARYESFKVHSNLRILRSD